MDAIFIGDLFREALYIVLFCVVLIILPSLIVGLVVATFQAATQINEQTLSFLPRLIMTILVLILLGPVLVGKVLDFVTMIFMNIPQLIG